MIVLSGGYLGLYMVEYVLTDVGHVAHVIHGVQVQVQHVVDGIKCSLYVALLSHGPVEHMYIFLNTHFITTVEGCLLGP